MTPQLFAIFDEVGVAKGSTVRSYVKKILTKFFESPKSCTEIDFLDQIVENKMYVVALKV